MKRLLLLIGLVYTAISCEKNIDLELPGGEPIPVLNALLQTGDSVVSATVNISVPYRLTSGPTYVKDAVLRLYENDVLLGFFSICEENPFFITTEEDTQYVFCLPAYVKEGSTYRIEADVPGYPTVSGETTAPGPPDVQDLQFNTTLQTLNFTFRDNYPGTNYYECELWAIDTTNEGFIGQVEFTCRDYSFELLGSGTDFINLPVDDPLGLYLFTTDEYFSEGQKRVSITPQNETTATLFYQLIVSHGSPEYYEYRRTRILNTFNGNSPFSEPVRIYSNVSSGLGIVAAFNMEIFIVEF